MILWCFDLKKHSFLAAFTQQCTNNPWAQGQESHCRVAQGGVLKLFRVRHKATRKLLWVIITYSPSLFILKLRQGSDSSRLKYILLVFPFLLPACFCDAPGGICLAFQAQVSTVRAPSSPNPWKWRAIWIPPTKYCVKKAWFTLSLLLLSFFKKQELFCGSSHIIISSQLLCNHVYQKFFSE